MNESAGPLATDEPDLSARVALRAQGLLRTFTEAGVLHAADVHVATRLGELCGEHDERVLLATALAVRGVRYGSVMLRLADVPSTVVADDADPERAVSGDLPWPEVAPWLAAVRASRLARAEGDPAGGDDGPRPLRMWGDDLWLDRYWRMEAAVAADLLRRAENPPAVDLAALDATLSRLWPVPDGEDVDADQREAARRCLLSGVAVLGGGPGTGKTTTVARVLAALRELAEPGTPPRIALAAPSAKARNRIEESLGLAARDGKLTDADRALLAAVPASTLHKLIGAYPSGTRSRYHRGNPLPYDVVVVDETSMVSLSMFARLLDALRPHARLVLVGDPDQLASVEAGAVLSDLDSIEGRGPVGAGVARLVTNRRSGDQPGLTALATAVRAGRADDALDVLRSGADGITWHEVADDLPLPASVQEQVRARLLAVTRVTGPAARAGDAATAVAALDRHRLLCAHRRGPRGVAHWNALVQRWVVDDDPQAQVRRDGRYAGLPLLVTENDYENQLWNGDTGVVVAGPDRLEVVIGRGASLTAPIPLGRLAAASPLHAMTVYKSQGSEFDAVTLLLPLSDSPLATRETLYTAVTRARHEVVVIGSEAAVRASVARRALRATGLGRRLLPAGQPAG